MPQVDTLSFSLTSPDLPAASATLSIDNLSVMEIPAIPAPQVGLHYWMKQALVRIDEASKQFDSHAVHGLRTALRRCRSMAEGLRVFDSDPGWKKMRRAGKELFSSLGALRDTPPQTDYEVVVVQPDPMEARTGDVTTVPAEWGAGLAARLNAGRD